MARRKHRRGSPMFVTPAYELFPKSYEYVRKNIWVFAVLYIFPLIIGLSNGAWAVDSRRHWSTDGEVASNALAGPTLPAYAYGGFGVALLFALIIATVLQIMLQSAQLEASEGRSVNLSRAWSTFRKVGLQMFGLYMAVAVMLLISLVPMLIYIAIGLPAIGAIILLIPAAIMLRRYFLAPYVLLDNPGMPVWEALNKSAELSLKDPWSIYSIMGVLIIFALFGAVPLIGWIAAFALHFFYNVAPAIRYRELKKLN